MGSINRGLAPTATHALSQRDRQKDVGCPSLQPTGGLQRLYVVTSELLLNHYSSNALIEKPFYAASAH
ncbi:MAG: hypothetical protein KME45_04660 [Stenomitos rutilans HA7619-LM2]|jgi:hypothetical protein|nr:hypothetical protein [Stenomitos rutilans HA7619-LM2]